MNRNLAAQEYLIRINPRRLAKVADALGRQKDGKERLGGVLAIQVYFPNDHLRSTTACMEIGTPGERMPHNDFFAHEKIRRVHVLRRAGKPDFASSESADPKQEKYGGCIVGLRADGAEVYIAYSGAPADVDEALAWHIGIQFDLDIPADYQNSWLTQLEELCDGDDFLY
jgi:hypothetical protein